MPAAFVTDFGPLPAFEDDDYAGSLARLGRALPRPRAALIMSGHYLGRGTLALTSSPRPETLHDYGGFSEEFYLFRYPCLGAPELAEEAAGLLAAARRPTRLDARRGLDHGAWAPLSRLFPAADVPVAQLSAPAGESPEHVLAIGLALAPLRERGVLLVASGALSHNLRLARLGEKDAPPNAWAEQFDAWLAPRLDAGDAAALSRYREEAPHAEKAAPTSEHFDPLFFALGAAAGARPAHFHRSIRYGNGLLRAFLLP